jgi:DUF971 family protein
MEPRFRPTAIKAPHGARIFELTWADGKKMTYPHEILRGYCPCAGCQGHEGTIKFVKPTSDIQMELDGIDPVGNYALQLTWFDGHSSGLYSYKYLRALCHCDQCRPGAAKEERGELPRS